MRVVHQLNLNVVPSPFFVSRLNIQKRYLIAEKNREVFACADNYFHNSRLSRLYTNRVDKIAQALFRHPRLAQQMLDYQIVEHRQPSHVANQVCNDYFNLLGGKLSFLSRLTTIAGRLFRCFGTARAIV